MKAEAIYRGLRTPNGCLVTCDGKELPNRTDLRKYSTHTYEWGHEGGGSSQLSLAIIADFCGDDMAMQLHQDFTRDIVSALGANQWEINHIMLHEWVRKKLKEHKADAKPGHFI
jgi:hypothetical protein